MKACKNRDRRLELLVDDAVQIRNLLSDALALASKLEVSRGRGTDVMLLARCAAVMRELVAYGSDRDTAISELVRKCATLQMKVEDMERGQ